MTRYEYKDKMCKVLSVILETDVVGCVLTGHRVSFVYFNEALKDWHNMTIVINDIVSDEEFTSDIKCLVYKANQLTNLCD